MAEVLSLRKSNCKNCHKCIRYCPVKAIRFSGNQSHIISEDCILCGRCYVVCPQDAKHIADARETVRVMIESDVPVVASLAPSFVAAFDGAGFSAMEEALKRLGFAAVEETAIGATLVKREYERLLAEGKQDIIISSACPSVNLLIERHYPQLCSCLAPVATPMVAHAKDIKRRMPSCRIVYIGSCIAAKQEAEHSPVDAVLTFAELSQMLLTADIEVERVVDENPNSRARLFPVVGGIIATLDKPDNDYTYITIDGTNDCRTALADIAGGGIHRCFIEMSACEGSCIGGPVMEKYDNYPIRHYQMAARFAGKEDFPVPDLPEGELFTQHVGVDKERHTPTETDIRRILKSMGKETPEDELNCGSCGYDTCREKAVAISMGIADMSMCLPFIMERAQRFSNNILDNSPNGVVVINDNFEIQQLNRTAMEMMNISRQADVLGENVIRILDPTPFFQVYEHNETVKNRRAYFSDYKKYFEQTIVRDKASKTLLCILRDVTDEEEQRKKKEEMGRKTAEIADKVVEKQMRIVQEIASLLGETTAETKVALTKLKESIESDEDE